MKKMIFLACILVANVLPSMASETIIENATSHYLPCPKIGGDISIHGDDLTIESYSGDINGIEIYDMMNTLIEAQPGCYAKKCTYDFSPYPTGYFVIVVSTKDGYFSQTIYHQ